MQDAGWIRGEAASCKHASSKHKQYSACRQVGSSVRRASSHITAAIHPHDPSEG
jgi:hypothetical protein